MNKEKIKVKGAGGKSLLLSRTAVPISYVSLGLDIARDRGVDCETLLEGIGIAPSDFERPEARVSLLQCMRLITRVVRQTPEHASLGYEFGLRSNLAVHGNVGFGLISHTSVGESLEFGLKYGRLRNPILKLELLIDGDQAVIDLRPRLPLGPMRQKAIDAVLISMARIGKQLGGTFQPQMELRFSCAQPAHYSRYQHRLPLTRFNARANQLRFPAEYLRRPLRTGDAASARLVVRQCERDLSLLGEDADLDDKVRALLHNREGRYPNLEAVAAKLLMSGRSLKRKLQHQGQSFQELMESARKRDSMDLLSDPSLAISEVAQRVGYSDPASFTRAFRKWTGRTPSVWRELRN